MSGLIHIPGSRPDPVPSTRQGSLGFNTTEGTEVYRERPLRKGESVMDTMVGNPAFRPFAVTVPFIESRLLLDPDLKHDVVFIRGGDKSSVCFAAVSIWDQFVKPKNYLDSADSIGEPACEALDEGDIVKIWRDAVIMYKRDPAKHKLVAVSGTPLCPYAFCMPGELMDFKRLCRTGVHDRKST